jgi:serine/threonine protein kinase
MFKDAPMSFAANKKADIWSLGIVFLALCFGASLWNASSKEVLYAMIDQATDATIDEKLDISINLLAEQGEHHIDPDLVALMRSIIRPMLRINPNDRPSAAQMLAITNKASHKLMLLSKSKHLTIPHSARAEAIKLSKGGGSVNLDRWMNKVGRASMSDIHSSSPLYHV